MDIMPPPAWELHLIQSYGAGRFVVQDKEITQHILIWPTGVIAMAEFTLTDATLDINQIQPLPELLIIGTGKTMRAIPSEIKENIKKQGVKIEAMDTGAACRTYNVLIAEDRRVAALLMVV